MDRIVRIVIINKYVHVTGGADLHCIELAEGLRDRGHEVAFISTADERNLDKAGVFIKSDLTNSTRKELSGHKAAQVAASAIWNASAAKATTELLSTFRPDIVHTHKLYPQLSVAPVVAASRHHVPIVQTVHDYEFISASTIDDTGGWRDRDEERAAYRTLNTALFGVKRLFHRSRVNKWISVSRSTAAAYREHGIPTTVLPNFTRISTEAPLCFENRQGILFLGRLTEEKGLRHVLELPNHLPQYPIMIAGDGPLSAEVERSASRFSSVTYLGKLDGSAVARQLASARLVVMPSLWREPGPLTALEAMSAGTPVIAYNTGGLAEYVRDAGGGIVVPPSATELARAISSIYGDCSRWTESSVRAREAVQRDHTRSSYLDRLDKVYVETLEVK